MREMNRVTAKGLRTTKGPQQDRSTQDLVIKDSDGCHLANSSAELNLWTEYCKDLYNFQLMTDASILLKKKSDYNQQTSRPSSPTRTGWKSGILSEGRKIIWHWWHFSWAAQTEWGWNNKGTHYSVQKILEMQIITQRMRTHTSHVLYKNK